MIQFLLSLFVMGAPYLEQRPEFQMISSEDSGDDFSAWSLSRDGQVVMGQSGESRSLAKWTAKDGIQVLGPKHLCLKDYVNAASNFVSGVSWNSGEMFDTYSFIWTQTLGFKKTSEFTGQKFLSIEAANVDGSLLVGRLESGQDSYLWSQSKGLEKLKTPPNHSLVSFHQMSDDGEILTGYSLHKEGSRGDGLIYSRAEGPIVVTSAPEDWVDNIEFISKDKKRFVGNSSRWWKTPHYSRPFMIDSNGNHQTIGVLYPKANLATIRAANEDLSLLGGYDCEGKECHFVKNMSAVIWDEPHGMRDLNEVFKVAGVDLSPLKFYSVIGISGDGKVMLAAAYNHATNKTSTWLIRFWNSLSKAVSTGEF